jgi:DNA polymerase IV
MSWNIGFNSKTSYIMHIDLNSCFATVEQQANPLLRGRPIAVAAYNSPNGCILAPSVEAKTFGIRTGMRVKDAKLLFPKLIVLSPDPWKYRSVHLKLKSLIAQYTNNFEPKSIDEFVLDMEGYPSLKTATMCEAAKDLKRRIKKEIGDYLTVSVGISTNRYLAKIAAGLRKPDGLDEINSANYMKVYEHLKLTDLTGIKEANSIRLSSMRIYTVLDFLQAPLWKLKAAFHSVNSLYWYQRLRGYEVDNILFGRKSYGNSTAIGREIKSYKEASPVMARLIEKMSMRLRHAGYKAGGIHLAVTFKDGGFWHEGKLVGRQLYDTADFLKAFLWLLMKAVPDLPAQAGKPIANIAVSAFNLIKNESSQLNFFSDVEIQERLTDASDSVNKKWGDFSLIIGRSMARKVEVMDRIAFGGVKELEEFALT